MHLKKSSTRFSFLLTFSPVRVIGPHDLVEAHGYSDYQQARQDQMNSRDRISIIATVLNDVGDISTYFYSVDNARESEPSCTWVCIDEPAAGSLLHERNGLYGKKDKSAKEAARAKELGTKKNLVARYAPGDVDKNSPWMIALALWPKSWKVCAHSSERSLVITRLTLLQTDSSANVGSVLQLSEGELPRNFG
jgi:hypothetical protein